MYFHCYVRTLAYSVCAALSSVTTSSAEGFGASQMTRVPETMGQNIENSLYELLGNAAARHNN